MESTAEAAPTDDAVLTADAVLAALDAVADPADAVALARYFKTGPGEYGEGDVFVGVRMGPVTAIAKRFVGMSVQELERLLDSPVHEARSIAIAIMNAEATKKSTSAARRRELYELYLRRHDRINNWDLVDGGCRSVLGTYLADKPRDVLYRLAASENLWERRSAIVTTWTFIRAGESRDVLALAERLLDDREDLIHKAVGWMLRELGEVDRGALLGFLEAHAATMPRTMLRYALEKLDVQERERFMGMRKVAAALAKDANA